MASIIHAPSHGLAANSMFYFSGVEPETTGVDDTATYFVLPGYGYDADNFAFSETEGGAPFTLLANITSGRILTEQAYAPVDDGVMSPPAEPEGPSDVSTSTSVTGSVDGSSLVRLTITFTPPTEDKTRSSYVEVTFTNDGDPIDPAPVWTEAEWNALFPSNPTGFVASTVYPVGLKQTFINIDNVLPNVEYWVRTWSEDVFGNRSIPSVSIPTVTAKDTEAPTVPSNLRVADDVNGCLVAWSANTEKDFAFCEIRYAPDDGSGTAPDTAHWTVITSRTSTIYVGNLSPSSGVTPGVADKRYWFQVRAIDTSGNVDRGASPAGPYTSYPEDGWTTAVAGNPRLTMGYDIGGLQIKPEHIDYLDANKIKVGTLSISLLDKDLLDGIAVFVSDGADPPTLTRVGRWDETGLYINAQGDASDYIRIFDGGISVFQNGVETAALTPEGVKTSSFVGPMPGGHNLITNSGFELYTVNTAGASGTQAWTAAADWNASRVGSDTNATTGDALTMTSVGY